jgi:hypothetical protein
MSSLGPIVVVKPITSSYSLTNPFSGHCILYPKSDLHFDLKVIQRSYIIQNTVCTCPFSAACGDALKNKTGKKQNSSLQLHEKITWFQMHVFVGLPDCELCL